MPKKLIFTFIFSLFLLAGCGEGITPEPEVQQVKEGFGGTITFSGTWPQGVKRTHIVAFKDPLLTQYDFNPVNLAFVSDSIPYGINQVIYSSVINPIISIKSGTYSYLAVAQSKTPNVSFNRKDWYVIGVFYTAGDTTKPGSLVIPAGNFVKDINIKCDFNNPPPQPPGG